MPAAIGAVVQIDDEVLCQRKGGLPFFPPRSKPVGQKVAGVSSTREEQERRPAFHFEDSTGYQFLLGSHVVVQCFHLSAAARLPSTGILPDMDDGLGVHTDSNRVRRRVGEGIYFPNISEDCIGFRRFF